MGLFVCYLYDRVFGYVGANFYNTSYEYGVTPESMKKAAVQELYDYGFVCPRIVLIRII